MSDGWIATRQPCPSCPSSDAFFINDRGWGKCFSCNINRKVMDIDGDEVTERTLERPKAAAGLITDYTIKDLPARHITKETCAKFGYGVGAYKGQDVHIAPYVTSGSVTSQKIRFRDKTFAILGEGKKLPLFGQNVWSGTGKMVVITEGEIDALSVSQVQDNKWPVVSLPNGAKSAATAIAHALEWLDGYERVVLMFDEDAPGREAIEAAASVLPPGKCYIARLPLKDANACLMAGKALEIKNAIWNATPYRPDSIVSGSDLLNKILTYKQPLGLELPYKGLQALTRGLRRGELITLVAGTGSGKSTLTRALAHHLIKQGEAVGILALEEDTTRTGLGLVGYELGKPLHVSTEGTSQQELSEAFAATLGRPGVFLYDHFGSTAVENIVAKVRYLAKAGGCSFVILDHLSIVVSGLDTNDERKAIDVAMTKLRTLVQETGIGLILVNHLRRGQGKSAEEGGEISLSDLRGSQSIAQLSDGVWALERNQQAAGTTRNLVTVRVLKNRFTGETGPACKLMYDKETGRLHEVPMDFGEEHAAGDEFDSTKHPPQKPKKSTVDEDEIPF